MLNNLDGFNYPNFPRKNYPIINKDQLPKRPFDPIILNDSKNSGGYIAGGNKEVEEFKKSLAQSSAGNAKKEERTTSDKSTPTDVGSTLAKQGLYELTGSSLLKPNPYLVAMTLLGVDFEEDGDALKKGAETGKLPSFKEDYKNYFNSMWDKADSGWNAAWEGFNMPANVISIGLQDCLQTAGVGLSKVIGKKTTEFLGSGVSTVGTAFNAIGDIAGDSVKGTVGIFKNLFTGDLDGVADSAKGIYNGAKDSVVDVANSVADFATDGADVVVDAAENVYDVAKDVGNGVADAANAVGGAVSDAADAVGDAVSDAADAVGDFFDSIF